MENNLQMVQSNLRQVQTQLDLRGQELKNLEADWDRVLEMNNALDHELTEARTTLAKVSKEKDWLGKDSSEA